MKQKISITFILTLRSQSQNSHTIHTNKVGRVEKSAFVIIAPLVTGVSMNMPYFYYIIQVKR
jgi:hypothetical protein